MTTNDDQEQRDITEADSSAGVSCAPRTGSDAPVDPRCQKVWKKRGMHLADAALTVARNDDCSALLEDEDAMPVSVCLLAMIYGISDDVAANAVRHWLRRPNAQAVPTASTAATQSQ